MPHSAIDLQIKAVIVGTAIAIALAMRALERYAYMRARTRTQRAIERMTSR